MRVESQARAAAAPCYIDRQRGAPAFGSTVRLNGTPTVVTSHGRPFRADEDTSSIGGPIGAEGEWCCKVYYRPATADEIAALEEREGATDARRRARSEVEAMVRRVDRDGEAVDLGREPEGEVLLRNDHSALAGYATRLVLDGEGYMWSVTYDGTDGGTWGMYNLGYNTRGSRLRVTSDEVAALRAAIETGGMPG